MADRIIVMNKGSIEQQGDPLNIYYEPSNPFVADFIGSSNILYGERVNEPISQGQVAIRLDNGGLVVCDTKDIASNRLAVAIKSVHLKLSHDAQPDAVNAWEVRVTRRSFAGDFVEYQLDWNGQPLLCRGLPDKLAEEGKSIICSVDPENAVMMEGSDISAR